MRKLLERLEDHGGQLVEQKIEVEGFVSGQEPDDLDDEFAADIEITGSIQGEEVARLLGKQRRVLVRELEKVTGKKALALISNGRNRISKEILKDAKKKVQKFLSFWASKEFNKGAKVETVDFSESEEYWSAKVDPSGEKIDFTIEVGVLGSFI